MAAYIRARSGRMMAGMLVLVVCMGGCQSAVKYSDSETSARHMQAELERYRPSSPSFEAAGSLFKEDQAVLSNQDFHGILAAEVVLPTRAKLAVVRFGQMPYWWGWSEDFVRMNERVDAEFLAKLRSSQHLRQVSYLPSLVTPREMTIPYLRQAAARFQADLLLVYRTSSQTYDRQKFLGKDESKAYCTVEAILLATRTGIIPFSTVLTELLQTLTGEA
jgi:hypothetical protein